MREPGFRRALPSDWRAIRTLPATSKLLIEGARERLPAVPTASAEFHGACPASATAMSLDLRPN
jgi:hypothetical protein